MNASAGLPLVTVCVPTFNRAAKLERCINHLLGCDFPHLEIVISDNASTDQTRALCEAFQRADQRVKYFRHPVNQGMSKNFEFARRQARGKYFMWLGDDDYIARDYISGCVAVLENDPSVVLASGIGAYHRGDGEIEFFGKVIQICAESRAARVLTYLWNVTENSIFCGLYRREAVEDFTIPNILAGDWAWMADVVWVGKARVDAQLFVYREYVESTSSDIDRLVATLKLPRWNARYPWIARAWAIAGHMLKGSNSYVPLPYANRFLLACAGALILLSRRVISELRYATWPFIRRQLRRLPFALAIYRRYFKADAAGKRSRTNLS